MKICFASDVHYPNYTKRIQESSLKGFLEYKLYEYDIHYYISTNRPDDLLHLNNENNIKIFDINELRKNDENSLKYEVLPENPIGTYPSKFPYNLRRFIIRQAAIDGFDYVIFLDCDVVFNLRPNLTELNFTSDDIVKTIQSEFEPGFVKTNVSIFEYREDSTSEVFGFHKNYLEHFQISDENFDFDSLDGPCMSFIGTPKDIINLTKIWDEFTNFGYKKEFGFGYQNGFISNLSFVIPLSNFKLKQCFYPFYPKHIIEDRYDANYVSKPNEFNVNLTTEVDNSILEKSDESTVIVDNKYSLSDLLKQYSCEKYDNGFSDLLENYLISITDKNPNILEIGIGTLNDVPLPNMNNVPANMIGWKERNPNYQQGNSLRVLRDFLKTGDIFGIDNQSDCEINEERIKTFIFDSRSKKLSQNFLKDLKFDLIIDDGDLDPNIRIINFTNYYEFLTDDGYYVIQDIHYIYKHVLEEYITELEIPYIIFDNYMVLNKKNDFEIIKKKNANSSIFIEENIITTPIFIENKIVDYTPMIESTPKFSIDGEIFADKGFYINLDTSIERKENVDNLIEKFNIDGLLRFEALRDVMIQFACTKSHLSVFETCLKHDIETVFVAEDDFNIENELYQPNSEPIYFQEKIKEIKKDLDNLEWDVFLFGCNPKTHIIPKTNNVGLISKSTGAWAYIIKKRAYTFLLENLNYKKDYIAIDDYLPLLNDNGFTTLTSIPLSIGHAVGFVSTLQPRGPVNYTDWIKGNYHKFLFDNFTDNDFTSNKIVNNLTIFIPGFFCENYMFYLRYALKSLPNELKKCKIIIRFDTPSENYDLTEFIKLLAYFRDVRNDLNVSLSYGFGGLISSFDYFLKQVKTPYFMMYEFDYVFLNKDDIDFKSIISTFEKHNFVNTIYFSGDDISLRGFDISKDVDGVETPFEIETRVSEINLVTTVRWSNRPAIHRVSKMKEWYDKYMWNENIGKIHQSCYGIEDVMIPIYHTSISDNKWGDIKDDWGTYLYGNFGEGPFIAHTDSSRRYQNDIKSALEINADKYVLEHPLTDND